MRDYRLIDYLTQGYVALTALLMLLFHGEGLPDWHLYFLAHLGGLALVHGIVRWGSGRDGFPGMLRAFYPMILYTFLFLETQVLDCLFVPYPLDRFFIALEQKLFDTQPCRTFILRYPYLAVSELLYFSYFTYYIMIPGVGFALYFRDREKFFHYVTVISFVFYVCYVTYIFLPVMGPHYYERLAAAGRPALLDARVVPGHLRWGPFYNVMRFVYRTFEPKSGAAFPSSHVAVALAALSFTWRYLRRIRWLHLIVVILLALSTVYCGYHYAVDIFGGMVAAALLVPLGELLYRKYGAADPSELAAPGG